WIGVPLGLLNLLELVEEMQVVGCDRGLDVRARRQAQIRIDAGDPDLAVSEPDGEQLFVAELLGDHHSALDRDLILVHGRSQPTMLRAHADTNRPPAVRPQMGETPRRTLELPSVAAKREMLAIRAHAESDEIHRRRADEARHKSVGGLAIKLERRADLLDDAIL